MDKTDIDNPMYESLFNATEAVTKAVTEALPGMVDAAVPELPKATGPALPSLP